MLDDVIFSPATESLLFLPFSGVSPVLTTWPCTWRGTSKMASVSRALRDDSGWLSWPVGDQRGRCVLGALTGAPPCSRQWKNMKQRRLLFAPYLVPPTPRCGDCSWKAFTKEREGGDGLEKKIKNRKNLVCLGRDSSVWCSMLFCLGGSWHSCGLPFLQWQCVCLCAWGLWVPATGCLCWLYGADGACTVELRVNGMDDVMCEGGFFVAGGGSICCLTENECKQKRFCLCCLSLLTVEGSRGGCLMEVIYERVPPLWPEVELQLPI